MFNRLDIDRDEDQQNNQMEIEDSFMVEESEEDNLDDQSLLVNKVVQLFNKKVCSLENKR